MPWVRIWDGRIQRASVGDAQRAHPVRRLSVLNEVALTRIHFEDDVAGHLILNIGNHGFRRDIPDEPAPRKCRGCTIEHKDFGWNETRCEALGDVHKIRHPGFWNSAFPAAHDCGHPDRNTHGCPDNKDENQEGEYAIHALIMAWMADDIATSVRLGLRPTCP